RSRPRPLAPPAPTTAFKLIAASCDRSYYELEWRSHREGPHRIEGRERHLVVHRCVRYLFATVPDPRSPPRDRVWRYGSSHSPGSHRAVGTGTRKLCSEGSLQARTGGRFRRLHVHDHRNEWRVLGFLRRCTREQMEL